MVPQHLTLATWNASHWQWRHIQTTYTSTLWLKRSHCCTFAFFFKGAWLYLTRQQWKFVATYFRSPRGCTISDSTHYRVTCHCHLKIACLWFRDSARRSYLFHTSRKLTRELCSSNTIPKKQYAASFTPINVIINPCGLAHEVSVCKFR